MGKNKPGQDNVSVEIIITVALMVYIIAGVIIAWSIIHWEDKR